ncbi:MAG: hypothetical protein ACRDYC_08520 [Acidimicrobiales bacterium]
MSFDGGSWIGSTASKPVANAGVVAQLRGLLEQTGAENAHLSNEVARLTDDNRAWRALVQEWVADADTRIGGAAGPPRILVGFDRKIWQAICDAAESEL